MKNILITLLLFSSAVSYAQIDTLIINFPYGSHHGTQFAFMWPEGLQDQLANFKGHRLSIVDFNEYVELSGNLKTNRQKRKTKKYFQEAWDCLNKILPEVKVLYICNPTSGPGGDGDDPPIVKYDTINASIYKLDFSKMTALQEVYLCGDDSDNMTDVPFSFYKTTVKIVHCYGLRYHSTLANNVKNRNKTIKVIKGVKDDFMWKKGPFSNFDW